MKNVRIYNHFQLASFRATKRVGARWAKTASWSLPPKSGETLLEIIMRRYENRSTLMTSNRPIEDWGKLLCDVPAASAILDRLLHHADILSIAGRSYRLQKNTNSQNATPASE